MSRRSPDETRRDFEATALPHADALFNFALRMTRSDKDAEDLVQDTLMRAFRFFHRFEPGTNCRAWLFRILKNVYINGYRRDRRTPDLVEWGKVEEFYDAIAPDETARRDLNPEEAIIEATIDSRIEAAIADLPTEYREVVLLNFTEDLSYKEIASILEIPIGTVMSRLHRGRKLLKARLEDYARSTGLLPGLPRRHPTPEEAHCMTRNRVVPISAWKRTGSTG